METDSSRFQALADALEVLGYKGIYHMREVFKNHHGQYWISALEAKYEGKGKQFRREEFEEFLGNYMACLASQIYSEKTKIDTCSRE